MIQGEEWRRTFVTAIKQLTAGDVVKFRLTEWAIKAEAQHGSRNPVEVAHEEWISDKRPPSN
jgi:SPX domain protein involved in polyphosphate accumulation